MGFRTDGGIEDVVAAACLHHGGRGEFVGVLLISWDERFARFLKVMREMENCDWFKT